MSKEFQNLSSWFGRLPTTEAEHYLSIKTQLKEREINYYPADVNIFRALKTIHFTDVRVVIIGQDPYHGKGQANGFCFAVDTDVPIPPSLANIFKELESDIGVYQTDRTLEHWASQNVLLLNSILTVKPFVAKSHEKLGWERLTDFWVTELSRQRDHLVFILWGTHAIKKSALISADDYCRHLIIKSPHPSPLSAHRGFFGSKPFSKTNEYLKEHQITPINW